LERRPHRPTTFLPCLTVLLQLFPGETIGLILDHAPSHRSVKVEAGLAEMNEKAKKCNGGPGTRLVLEWIDPCLTSVYQPGDISINKPLKENIKNRHALFTRNIVNGKSGPFRAGQAVKATREDLLGFIEAAFNDINEYNDKKRAVIKETFEKCGLNPWLEDKTFARFREHLDALSTEKVYQIMMTCNEHLPLDKMVFPVKEEE
jgi:hypothetical protein